MRTISMKKIKKIFKWLVILTISVCFFWFAFIFVFFYDNTQYKQIGDTNFYLRPNELGEGSGSFLFHDGGEESLFFPINHNGSVHDVYWNQQYVIIKCSEQKKENWYIIRNLKYYSYPEFGIKHYLNENDYNRSLDSLGISEKNMEHTDGSIPWRLHLY